MKQYIIILLVGLGVACTTSENEVPGVCYTLIERQCAMDPFSNYFKDIKTLEERARAVDLYLSAQGIDDATVKSNPVSTDAVCLACICPSGYSYQLLIPVTDTVKLNTLNLSLIKRSCD